MVAFEHALKIVKRHRHRQSLQNPYQDDTGDLLCPAIIITPSGREILFDSEMLKEAADLADTLREDDITIKQSAGSGEWRDQVRQDVAYALDLIDPNADLDLVASHIIDQLKSSPKRSKGKIEFCFGCSLFKGAIPKQLRIGPVLFETREDWLERKYNEGAIPETTRRCVLDAWTALPPHERDSSQESRLNETVLGLSRDVAFICSVTTNGMAYQFARQRAQTTARLALVAIALLWERTSDALNEMNLVDDRVARILHELAFEDGQIRRMGCRKNIVPGGQHLAQNEWENIQSEKKGYFQFIGEILNSIVDVVTAPRRPQTAHVLTHALLWFHQGCREDLSAIAVANFASALDCLSMGDGREGIKQLIKYQLGLEKDQKIWKRKNQTVEQAVDEIYDHVRNGIIHGRIHEGKKPDSKPFDDWEDVRDRAESLTRHALLRCINISAKGIDNDAPHSWQKLAYSVIQTSE